MRNVAGQGPERHLAGGLLQYRPSNRPTLEEFAMIQLNTLPMSPVSLISRYLSAGLPIVDAEGNPSVAYRFIKR